MRAFVFCAPIAAAVATSWLLNDALGHPRSGAELAWHIVVTFGVSTLVLFGTQRYARRLMPLAILLRLTLAFPDQAPSRWKVARGAASTKDLERRVEHAKIHGTVDQPTLAAEQILQLIAAVEAHDRATRGHSERVRIYTDLVAEQLALPLRDRDRLRWAAMLHDVGKLEVPRKILNKPSKLQPREWERIREHPAAGARLVAPLRGWLGEWAEAVEQHHERFDGSGYPSGLTGAQISLGGRIVAVTDAYETMTAHRPYRRARSAAKARAELVRCSGTDFDPVIVRAFLEISIRRLTVLSGPLSWLAQTPLLNGIQHVTGAAGLASSSAAAVGGAFALTLSPVNPQQPASSAPSKPPIERAAQIATPPPAPWVSSSPTATASPRPSIAPSPSVSPTAKPSKEPSPSPSPSERPKVKTPSPSHQPTDEPGTRRGPDWLEHQATVE